MGGFGGGYVDRARRYNNRLNQVDPKTLLGEGSSQTWAQDKALEASNLMGSVHRNWFGGFSSNANHMDRMWQAAGGDPGKFRQMTIGRLADASPHNQTKNIPWYTMRGMNNRLHEMVYGRDYNQRQERAATDAYQNFLNNKIKFEGAGQRNNLAHTTPW